MFSGDLNSELVKYSNGPEQFVHRMVRCSSHVLKSELKVCNSNGTKFVNRMAFGYQTFYHGCSANGPDHSISARLDTEQVKVCYSDVCYLNVRYSDPHCIRGCS